MPRKKKVEIPQEPTKELIPSIHQENVFEVIKDGVKNIIINAVSGSGKTTTIVNAIKLIPIDNTILYLAYNVDIVKELKKKLKGTVNTDIRTCHSLGYKIITMNLNVKNIEVNDYKYKNIVRELCHEAKEYSTLNNRDKQKYFNNTIALLDFSRLNLCQSITEIEDISIKYDIDLFLNEISLVKRAMDIGMNNLTIIDYIDMIWLPNELMMDTKKLKYDWIFVDEAQDLSVAQQKLFQKCFRRGTRFCAVGDEKQCINTFAGSDEDAFHKLKNIKTNTVELPLPISYRCPKLIVEKAKRFSPLIEAKEDAIDGEIIYDVLHTIPQDGDMVLCRNTAPLIRLYTTYLRINKKSYIRGKDIGNNLIKMVKSTGHELLIKSLVTTGVFYSLYESLIDRRNLLMTKFNLDIEDANTHPEVIDMFDTINALEILSEGLTTSNELIDKIKAIFVQTSGDGVCLSTIHKAKGLEADNVYILCPSLLPSKLARKEWEIKTEENLEYVAITRAKKKLCYVSEKDFPPRTVNTGMSNTIQTIELRLNSKTQPKTEQRHSFDEINIKEPNKTKAKNDKTKKGFVKFGKFMG